MKYFSLTKGLLKLDLIVNLQFMITLYFLWANVKNYSEDLNWYVLGGNILFNIVLAGVIIWGFPIVYLLIFLT
jgi:hypothetical protein